MLKRRTLFGELSAEFLGTFFILLFGIASVTQYVTTKNGPVLGIYGPSNIPWAWGIGVALAVYVAGGLSGAHLNPAVTIGLALRRGFAWSKVVPYWIAQTAGAFVAAGLCYWNYHDTIVAFDPGKTVKTQGIFSTLPNAAGHIGVWGGFRDEVLVTAVLVIVIFALIDERNQAPAANLGPLIIGLLIVAIGFSFGQNSGWAINPARDFGPRLFEWIAGWKTAWRAANGSLYFWVPIIGPLIGGALGACIYDLFIGRFLPIEQEVGEQARAAGEDTARDRAEDNPTTGA